jgi:hypothetical protein
MGRAHPMQDARAEIKSQESPCLLKKCHSVEVATEAELLSLSIYSACTYFVVALECVLLASLPRACSPLAFLALCVVFSHILVFGFWLPCFVPCVSARHRATEITKPAMGEPDPCVLGPCAAVQSYNPSYTPGAHPDPTNGVPLWTSARSHYLPQEFAHALQCSSHAPAGSRVVARGRSSPSSREGQ